MLADDSLKEGSGGAAIICGFLRAIRKEEVMLDDWDGIMRD